MQQHAELPCRGNDGRLVVTDDWGLIAHGDSGIISVPDVDGQVLIDGGVLDGDGVHAPVADVDVHTLIDCDHIDIDGVRVPVALHGAQVAVDRGELDIDDVFVPEALIDRDILEPDGAPEAHIDDVTAPVALIDDQAGVVGDLTVPLVTPETSSTVTVSPSLPPWVI